MPEDYAHKYKSEKSSFIDILIEINQLFALSNRVAIEIRDYDNFYNVRRYYSILKQIWWNIQPVVKDKMIIDSFNNAFRELNTSWIDLYRKNQIDKLDLSYIHRLEDLHQDLFNLRQDAGLGLPMMKQRSDEEIIDQAIL